MADKEKICFVVSPIGQPGSDVRQKADDFLQFIVEACEAIIRLKYKVVRADQITEPGRITTQVIRLINSAALVIADVTGGNENVYYELSLRHALGLPLITCAEAGTVLPFDTRDNRTIFYSMHSRQAKEAREELSNQINAVNAEGFTPDNPIYEALKVIKLAESTDTGERTMALMLQKLDDLGGRMSAMERRIVQASVFTIGSGGPNPFLGGSTFSPAAAGALSAGLTLHPSSAEVPIDPNNLLSTGILAHSVLPKK